MTHWRGLVLLTLLLCGTARRSIRIDDSHHDAQQQTKIRITALEVSAQAREALNPNDFINALSTHQRPRAGVLRAAHGQVPRLTSPRGQPRPTRFGGPAAWRPFGPRRAIVALQAPIHSESEGPLNGDTLDHQPVAADGGAWLDDMKEKYMREVWQGTEGGGWDNDDYLAETKANPPVTSNVELLRQAEAYVAYLAAHGVKPKLEYQQFIDDLRAQMSPEELRQVNSVDPWATRDAAQAPMTDPATPSAALAVPAVPAPGTVESSAGPAAPVEPPQPVSAGGVMSGMSYAALTRDAAPAPVTDPATPSAALAVPAVPAPEPVESSAAPAGPVEPPTPVSAGGVMSGMSYAALTRDAAQAPVTDPAIPSAALAVPAVPAPPATPAAPVGTSQLPQLPPKEPRDLRGQYKAYLKKCGAQSREPDYRILQNIHRLYNEKPPAHDEQEDLEEIRMLEQQFGLTIHSGGGLPEAGTSLVTPARSEGYSDEDLGPRFRRMAAYLRNESPGQAAGAAVAQPAVQPAAQPAAQPAVPYFSPAADPFTAARQAIAELTPPQLAALSDAERDALLGSLIDALTAVHASQAYNRSQPRGAQAQAGDFP